MMTPVAKLSLKFYNAMENVGIHQYMPFVHDNFLNLLDNWEY